MTTDLPSSGQSVKFNVQEITSSASKNLSALALSKFWLLILPISTHVWFWFIRLTVVSAIIKKSSCLKIHTSTFSIKKSIYIGKMVEYTWKLYNLNVISTCKNNVYTNGNMGTCLRQNRKCSCLFKANQNVHGIRISLLQKGTHRIGPMAVCSCPRNISWNRTEKPLGTSEGLKGTYCIY